MRLAPASRVAQRGVSLIIAMVMLVVIGFVSVGIMRRASSADQVALNNRLQTQASESAQAALKFCENEVTKVQTAPVNIQAAPVPPALAAWTKSDNWLVAGKNVAYTLKSTDLPGTVAPVKLPQCIIEHSPVNASLYVITARGFSNDFTANASGTTLTGSVVWLQSNLLFY
jgi:Tfp pilus assembly protein PilX